MPTPTKTAVAANAPVVFPNAVAPAPSTGSFEAGVAARHSLRGHRKSRAHVMQPLSAPPVLRPHAEYMAGRCC
jgi:hypothetical protein